VLHIVLLSINSQGFNASLAGLAIDLRYVLFFSLVYLAMCLYPNYRKVFIQVGVAGAFVVSTFALLQVFLLPHDILKYIGYNVDTIKPYLTVDQNHAFIRINSTLRGPNSLGAYAGMVLTLITAFIAKRKTLKNNWSKFLLLVIFIGSAVALWVSYSRSAIVATIIAITIVLFVTILRKLSTKMWITIVMVFVVLVVGISTFSSNSFISNVLLHENPTNIDSISSNEGHVDSLKDGITRLIIQPLGGGIGSTGSASLFTKNPLIIENQYLFVAHEVGWLGLLLFLYILSFVLYRLWNLRRDWLALGVFASGIGIALICLLLPILVDDTVAVIWWGFAAIALFPKKERL